MTDRKSGRNTAGTFAAGNPGKPKGTRHKTTQEQEPSIETGRDGIRILHTVDNNGQPKAERIFDQHRPPPLRRPDTHNDFDF